MSPVRLGRRALLTLALAFGLVAPAFAAPPAAGPCPQAPQSLRTEPLSIATRHGVARFTVEIADDDRSREIGLMCRRRLAADRGMLFDFKTVQPSVAFWMKNTLIPLDMVFIGADGRVVSVAHDARPLDETPIYAGGPTLAVLEIAGGRAAQLDIEPGDRVSERIFPR